MHIDLTVTSSESESEDEEEEEGEEKHPRTFPLLDGQALDDQGLPYTRTLEVRPSPIMVLDYLLGMRNSFLVITSLIMVVNLSLWINFGNVILINMMLIMWCWLAIDVIGMQWIASLGRYVNWSQHSSARLVCYPRRRTARWVATRRIPPHTEITGTYGIGHPDGRTSDASVSEQPIILEVAGSDEQADFDIESKYDVPTTPPTSDSTLMEEDMITAEPGPLPMDIDEHKTVAAMEYRGKVAPPSREQRAQPIDAEHARGHFGREAIFRALYRAGYWWAGIRRDIQDLIRRCIPCLRHVISKMGFDPSTPISSTPLRSNSN